MVARTLARRSTLGSVTVFFILILLELNIDCLMIIVKFASVKIESLTLK